MSWLAGAALLVGVVAVLVSALGVLLARDAFDRLHYVGPANILGSIAVGAAALLEEGPGRMAGLAAIVTLLLLLTGPVLTHAIGRAGVVRGDARRLRGEAWELDE